MKQYYRIMPGRRCAAAEEFFAGGFIGIGFGIDQDLSRQLPDEWREFNKTWVPVLQSKSPGKTKISAGLASGMVWTVCKGLRPGDVVLVPDGSGTYHVGEVVGEYYFVPNQGLPHRRKVRWLEQTIARTDMSDALQRSTGSMGTTSDITQHAEEIERLLGHAPTPGLPTSMVAAEVEDPVAFAMEKHLEDFLVANWSQTLLAKEWDIYEEEGEPVGQQYVTDAGTIDVLAISKDRKRLLVVELKRGRASDAVVGQVLRYVGYVREQVAETDQQVEGAIIALDEDKKMRWALLAVPNISFYRYEISFKLMKG
jgi:restriction system protein